MGYSAFLFDFYGTLAEVWTDESSLSFWKKISAEFEKQGVLYEPEKAKETYFRLIRETEEREHQEGRNTEIDILDVFSAMFEEKKEKRTEEELVSFAETFRVLSRRKLRLYAGAKALLESLREKGVQLYLLSNAQKSFTMPEIRELGIENYFEDIFLSSAVGYKKPDLFFVEALLKKHHLKPEECLLIGNDVFTDVETAKKAGMDCIYIHSALSSKTDLKDIDEKAVFIGMDLRKLKRFLLKSLK